MSHAITISGNSYTVRGLVRNQANQQPVADMTVTAYDKDLVGSDYLGIARTDASGAFAIQFDRSAFAGLMDRHPDLYFTVTEGGTELLNTRDHLISNADAETGPIVLELSLSEDKLRSEIQVEPVPGWVGGFSTSNPAFAYPSPDLSSLPVLHNMDNIDKLQRQMKVLWPEFSWDSQPGAADPRRCYQMFAPDISRMGYTSEGRVYSIICPQQGFYSPALGNMNVEVTVTGNRGWANESDKTFYADMGVEGRIWFSPSAHENPLVKMLWHHMRTSGLPFPATKKEAIRVPTFKPGHPDQPLFPLYFGESTNFPIPEFARHPDVAWAVGHLAVEMGPLKKTGVAKVDDFNQMMLDVFNLGSGNLLRQGNVLSWNVWITAPELVDQQEWHQHAHKWRLSIDVEHCSPDGNPSLPRHYDGTPLKPIEERVATEMNTILEWIRAHS